MPAKRLFPTTQHGHGVRDAVSGQEEEIAVALCNLLFQLLQLRAARLQGVGLALGLQPLAGTGQEVSLPLGIEERLLDGAEDFGE